MEKLPNSLNANEALGLEKFPIDVFPNEIQTIVKELDRVYGFTYELTSPAMLFALSVAIGNTYYVEAKEGWADSASLYIVLIGNAGSGKTHAIKWFVNPLQKYDAKFKKQYDDELLKFKREEGLERPNPKQILVQDITLEGLIGVHQNNPRGIGVYVDELGTWIEKFNAYRSGGGDKQNWISIWSNTQVSVNRKTNNEYVRIETPFVSVIGGVQRETFNTYLGNLKGHDGFTDRLFMVNAIVPYKAFDDSKLDDDYKNKWGAIIDTIYNYPQNFDTNGSVRPNLIGLSEEASEHFQKWDNENAINVNSGKADKQLVPKARTQAFRFALILEILYCSVHNVEPKQISGASMNKGIRLADYYVSQQLDVRLFANSSPIDKLDVMKRQMYDLLPDVFKRDRGVEILSDFDVSVKTIDTFLGRKDLFKTPKYGYREKL